MRRTLKQVLMERDKLSAEEANELIEDARADLEDCLFRGDLEEAERICEIHFGLEPDYLDELL